MRVEWERLQVEFPMQVGLHSYLHILRWGPRSIPEYVQSVGRGVSAGLGARTITTDRIADVSSSSQRTQHLII